MKSMPDVSIEKINPTKAKMYLEKNKANRPLTQWKIDQYAFDMKNGKWTINNDAICFNVNDIISNGQHRLHAVIKSGQACDFLVIRKMDTEAFKYMDTQKTRTASDILGIEGYAYPGRISAIAKFIMNFQKNTLSEATKRMTRGTGMTNADISAFVDKHGKKIIEAMPYGYRKENRSILPGATLAGLYFIFSKKDEQMANDFCDRLITGLNLTIDSPIYVLRQKLINDIRATKKMKGIYKLALVCKAWNFFASNKRITQFGWDSLKEPFPKPIA